MHSTSAEESTSHGTPSEGQRLFHGARNDLEALIGTHLFVISPNNSGSTFLKNVLATSNHTWNLRREGQHAFGFAGPSPTSLDIPYLWASEERWLEQLANADAFDWATIRLGWYFQAFSRRADATVFVEKSPPFLLHVAALAANFNRARFVFLVRNPYAVAEGISRATESLYSTRTDALLATARHINSCLALQDRNVRAFGEVGCLVTYEGMCDQTSETEAQIQALVPELVDLDLAQRVEVKGNYFEQLRNMNSQQIERLSVPDVDTLNGVFDETLFKRFGYEVANRSELT